jgi:PAS domain S-box-containing protein
MAGKKEEFDTTEIILDSIVDGVFTVDEDWKITSFNKAAEDITGIPREEAIGQRCCDVFRASICESGCALRETIETNRAIINKPVYIIDANGRKIPISISAAILKDKDGKTIGGVETFRDLSAYEELRRALDKKYSFQNIISKNSEMLKIFDILPTIAQSDSNVLIIGKSGTGKELIARAIHNISPRSDKPMITINCGALPDTLLESELFGHKAGAFTDARKDKPGRFALAEGGTIFLDEIGDISPAMQVRLLRVIQEKTYEPLGGTESLRADVRILAASNENLVRLVKSGKFREDLYYRINVIRLDLPPLKNRKEDIPLLIDYFINRFNKLKNKAINGISPDTMAILMNYDYPGNIRELEHIIERAFVLCQGSIINISDLPAEMQPERSESIRQPKSLDDLEARFIIETLRKNNWNRSATAHDLGMHKTTLWRKMKKLGIDKLE